MVEGKRHKAAVARLAKLFEKWHWERVWNDTGSHGDKGWKLPHPAKVGWQDKLYSPVWDCMASVPAFYAFDSPCLFHTHCRVAFEVDGMHSGGGHKSKQGQLQDRRKAELLKEYGIPTVRFTIDELVGEGARTDEEIKEEIKHVLKTGELRRI